VANALTMVSLIGNVFTIPGYGCVLLGDGTGCLTLQWLGLILAMVAALATGITNSFDTARRADQYETASKNILQLSREVFLELSKSNHERTNASDFAAIIFDKYDLILQDVRLPWYIRGEQQLANLSLIEGYALPHSYPACVHRDSSSSSSSSSASSSSSSSASSSSITSSSSDAEVEEVDSSDAIENDGAHVSVPLTDNDRAIMRQLTSELERLGGADIDAELAKFSMQP